MPIIWKKMMYLSFCPDTIHFGHKPCSVKTKFMWCHFRSSGDFYYSETIKLPEPVRKSIYSYDDRVSHLIFPLYKHIPLQEVPEFSTCFSRLVSGNVDKYQQTEKQRPISLSPLECQETFLHLMEFFADCNTPVLFFRSPCSWYYRIYFPKLYPSYFPAGHRRLL